MAAALAVQPDLEAARLAAAAEGERGRAASALPAPELMAEAWQVPLERPVAFADAQMLSLGLRQAIPAPGSLGARADAAARRREGAAARGLAREAELRAEVLHALADVEEADRRRELHLTHRDVAERVFLTAQARMAAGGKLVDVAQAELARARIHADVTMDAARAAAARARLNVWLGRAPAAPLGALRPRPSSTVAESDEGLLSRASAGPPVREAQAQEKASAAVAEASAAEARWPAFTVGLSYFAPTNLMPFHGYGATLGASLPWLWGPARAQRDADRYDAESNAATARGAKLRARAELVFALGRVRQAEARVVALGGAALAAARRAQAVALAAYEAGQGDLLGVLAAEQAATEVEVEHLAAETELEHAVVDAERIVGGRIVRQPLAAGGGAP